MKETQTGLKVPGPSEIVMAESAQRFAKASVSKRTQVDARLALDPALLSLPFSSSTRIQRMIKRRGEFASQYEYEIESSKDHWSELESKFDLNQPALADVKVPDVVEKQRSRRFGHFRRKLGELFSHLRLGRLFSCNFQCMQCANCVSVEDHQHHVNHLQSLESLELEDASDSEIEETNREILERIKKQWGGFFSEKWGDNLVLGPKIAEGGQAEIFEVEGGVDVIRMEFVVKAFKKGYSLRSLETQWPHGMLQSTPEGHLSLVNSSIIFAGTVVEDDRFAFVMYKYWGDLRKLIDIKMEQRSNQGPPFQEWQAISIMLQIANGMEQLHRKGILHKDLKTSNVLIKLDVKKRNPPDPRHASEFSCVVADYECSVGVMGTGFWRAPEVLVAVMDGNLDPSVFTEEVDVYSFAMTCYEILTGCIPFEDLHDSYYDAVLNGRRPELPHPMNSRLTELLCRCWHSNPLERPSFEEIRIALETIQRSCIVISETPSPNASHRSRDRKSVV